LAGFGLNGKNVGVHSRKNLTSEEQSMSEHVYKVTELVGSSTISIEEAIQAAIGRASVTLRNLRWFEVLETRGHIDAGKVQHYQVTLKVGFTMDDS
jgi:flavin-binding protein dodecin